MGLLSGLHLAAGHSRPGRRQNLRPKSAACAPGREVEFLQLSTFRGCIRDFQRLIQHFETLSHLLFGND
jgi:hypothetical protein